MFFEKNYISKTVKIGGMSCNHCKNRIETAFKALDEVKSIDVSLENNTAVITLKKNLSDEVIRNTIEDLGFSFEGVE